MPWIDENTDDGFWMGPLKQQLVERRFKSSAPVARRNDDGFGLEEGLMGAKGSRAEDAFGRASIMASAGA